MMKHPVQAKTAETVGLLGIGSQQGMLNSWRIEMDDSEIKSPLFCIAVMRPNTEAAESPN